ncbi:MAG: Rrf2 family transcriptional regulator [SAR324 cluster bacterium]|nr:Rrf2 family transcriptional regulator [SAR324 cluster bacterium]
MKITYKTDYSLKIILDLTRYYPGELVHIADLSQRQDIPKKFLEQLLLELKKGGFVQSKKGPNGGYFLTRDPAQISLGEVVRFVNGPIFPISCIDPDVEQYCSFKAKCAFVGIWRKVERETSKIVDVVSFA